VGCPPTYDIFLQSGDSMNRLAPNSSQHQKPLPRRIFAASWLIVGAFTQTYFHVRRSSMSQSRILSMSTTRHFFFTLKISSSEINQCCAIVSSSTFLRSQIGMIRSAYQVWTLTCLILVASPSPDRGQSGLILTRVLMVVPLLVSRL
jgi:hypothetical protein